MYNGRSSPRKGFLTIRLPGCSRWDSSHKSVPGQRFPPSLVEQETSILADCWLLLPLVPDLPGAQCQTWSLVGVKKERWSATQICTTRVTTSRSGDVLAACPKPWSELLWEFNTATNPSSCRHSKGALCNSPRWEGTSLHLHVCRICCTLVEHRATTVQDQTLCPMLFCYRFQSSDSLSMTTKRPITVVKTDVSLANGNIFSTCD